MLHLTLVLTIPLGQTAPSDPAQGQSEAPAADTATTPPSPTGTPAGESAATATDGAGTPEAMTPGIWYTTPHMTEVRSGPNHANYPFLRVPAGTPLEVKGDAFGYAKIATTGPAFRTSTGWILIDADEADSYKLSDDGVTGTITSTCQVMAPDLNSTNIDDAFRWVGVLQGGDTVDVIETVSTAGGGEAWRIRMPATAEGWVPVDALRRAGEGESTTWPQGNFPKGLTGTPDSPLTNWAKWSDHRTAWADAMQAEAQKAAEAARLAEAAAAAEADRIRREAQAAAEARAEAEALAAKQEEEAKRAYVNDRFRSLEALVNATSISGLDDRAASRLVEAYTKIANEEAEAHPDLAHLATFRADQIRLGMEINADRDSISGLRAQVEQSTDDLTAEAQSLSTIADYVIQGRLAVSLVFDGQNKPIMYRIEDPLSGRSLAYLAPSTSLDLSSLLGQRIGVVGTIDFDPDWHVTVVQPDRVDLVSVTP